MAIATVTIEGVLDDSSANPVPNEPLDFKWSPTGANTYTDLGTSTTNTTGIATKSVQLTAGQKYDFLVGFAGDATAGLNASQGTLVGFQATGNTSVKVTATSA